ncbi:MAG: histidine phosphatase family protein [Candidatus Micrarchaeaceae archaeon]
MTLIILVRHGESIANVKHTLSDELNVFPLTKNGLKQAKNAGIELKQLKIEYVYSSPVLRTMQTAEIICKQINKNFEINEKLIERKFNTMRGTKVTDNKWKLIYENKIEPFEILKKRIYSFILSQEKNSCVLAVTHHDPIIAAFSYIFNLDSLNSFSFRPTYASITAIKYEKRVITPLFFGLPFLTNEAIKKIPKKYKW